MNKFVTAVSCIDGRVQESVLSFMKKQFSAMYVDNITMPGVDGVLAKGENKQALEVLKNNIEISVNVHNSNVIAVFAHYDCAGNPVPETEHIGHLNKAVELVKKWFPGIEVYGFWIDENWTVQEPDFFNKKLK